MQKLSPCRYKARQFPGEQPSLSRSHCHDRRRTNLSAVLQYAYIAMHRASDYTARANHPDKTNTLPDVCAFHFEDDKTRKQTNFASVLTKLFGQSCLLCIFSKHLALAGKLKRLNFDSGTFLFSVTSKYFSEAEKASTIVHNSSAHF